MNPFDFIRFENGVVVNRVGVEVYLAALPINSTIKYGFNSLGLIISWKSDSAQRGKRLFTNRSDDLKDIDLISGEDVLLTQSLSIEEVH